MKPAIAAMMMLAAAACYVAAQTPNRAAIAGSKEDEDAVARGAALFAANCASCHGPLAKGTTPATDLIRSVLVRDDEKGELIGPVLRAGHAQFNDNQVREVVAWLHAQVYAAANRGTYEFLNILTGDAKKGETFFNGEGKCNSCHSPGGDLKGIGEKYDPPVLQSLWLNPRRGRGIQSRSVRTVTVTLPASAPVTGTLQYLDEFNVALRDAAGAYRSFTINDDLPHIEVHDPLQDHFDYYRTLTDADMHNVTAYLVTLQ